MPGRPAAHLRDAASLDARIDDLIARQRAYFASGVTYPRAFREEQLAALEHATRKFETKISEALYEDLRKGKVEAYGTEIGFVLAEAKHSRKHVGRWMRGGSWFSPLLTAPSRSRLHFQPLGTNLIISPWNYPFHLAFVPLVGAIAAGNVAVIKPSELAPATASVVAELVRETFDEAHVAVVEGDVTVAQALLARPWDHLFFTGSTEVGRIVAKAGAQHLSRVTLELGGKSPAIVQGSAELEVTAKRLVWGKFTNAGQTCVAPDYLLAHSSIHDQLIERMGAAVRQFYGGDPRQSPDYGRIITPKHYKRLVGLIDPAKVRIGGDLDESDRYIGPTVMTGATLDDAAMAEEIFGPILPVIRYETLDEAIAIIGQRPNPLALYLFTRESRDEDQVIERVSFGGGCINNTLVHMADPEIPFGGIGASGVGSHHGHYSFEAFSHRKGVLKTGTFLDPGVKYPPYDDAKLSIVKKLLG
ncbi:MAG: aldehyde dehydrogenase [Deltaproteobacteria bacterium]|nr:aldehyde dehydrogenase [Nannocystaceae bacterium]